MTLYALVPSDSTFIENSQVGYEFSINTGAKPRTLSCSGHSTISFHLSYLELLIVIIYESTIPTQSLKPDDIAPVFIRSDSSNLNFRVEMRGLIYFSCC